MDRQKIKYLRRVGQTALANGISALRQQAHIDKKWPISRPNQIYVMINNRCNLRCHYCDIWKNKGEDDLDTETWLRVFDELLDWCDRPKLNISGGEPFLRKDIFEILGRCIDKGALTGVVTNGWAMTPKMAPRVAELGLTNLNISIDSLDPEISDMMRGRPGHTERTIESIRRVANEVRRRNKATKIYLKTVVCGSNATSILPLLDFVEEEGLDGITYQPLEAVFSRREDYGNAWFEHTPLWNESNSLLGDVADELALRKTSGAPITNTLSHLARWRGYFNDPTAATVTTNDGDPETCRIGHSHLFINADGSFKLCWSFDDIGNVRVDDIAEAWRSPFAESIRDDIAACTEPCTKTCLLERSLSENASAFWNLVKPRDGSAETVEEYASELKRRLPLIKP